MVACIEAETPEVVIPGAIYATRAALKAAEDHLTYLRRCRGETSDGIDPRVDAHGDSDPGSLDDANHVRRLSDEIDGLEFVLYKSLVMIIDDQIHDKRPIVMPGTEITTRTGDKERTWIILGPLDQRQDVHPLETMSRIASYHSPLIEPLLGHHAGEKVTIPCLPNGMKNVEIIILDVKPWPPQAKKRSHAKEAARTELTA